MQKKRTLVIIVLIVCVIVMLGVLFTYIIYLNLNINRTKGLVETLSGYLINITSLVIAFIALIIALITYFSIDSVNSVTAMEGNVLENPNYAIAYSEMMMDFKDCMDVVDFKETLLQKVYQEIKHPTTTCIQFADCVQHVIDYIIWFAYIDFSDDDLAKQCEDLIRKLEKEAKRYNSLSNGIQYTLNENIKLIRYVMTYQKGVSLDKNNICHLENIRGRMLQNPISQIVYYDYLGLDYRKKANEIMKKCGSMEREFTYEYMDAVRKYSYRKQDIQYINILLKRSKESFCLAYSLADGDVVWESYIRYNIARVYIMEYLLNADDKKFVCGYLEETIKARTTVCFLFGQEYNYLSQQFGLELDRANNLLQEFKKL